MEEPVPGIIGLEPQHQPRPLPNLNAIHRDWVLQVLCSLVFFWIVLAAPEQTSNEIWMRWVANSDVFAGTRSNLKPMWTNKAASVSVKCTNIHAIE